MDKEIPKQERQRRKRRIIILWSSIVAIVVGIIIGVGAFLQPTIKKTEIVLSVASAGELPTTVNASGTVVPAHEQIIVSPISSRIIQLYVHEGDTVGAGTSLLELDLLATAQETKKLEDQQEMKRLEIANQHLSDDATLANLKMQIEIKKMELSRREADLANELRLDSLGTGTGERVREARLLYETGKLELAQQQKQLESETSVRQAASQAKDLELSILQRNCQQQLRTLQDARICAPTPGTVTYLNTAIGSQIAAGERLAIIADLSARRIDAQIPEIYSPSLVRGAQTLIKLGNFTCSGIIAEITPQAKGGMVSFTVEPAAADMNRLRAGAKVEIYVTDRVIRPLAIIDNGAYYKGRGEYELFVLEDDATLRRRRVELGEASLKSVAVISGIAPGETVVVSDMKPYSKKSKLKLK